MTLAGRDENRKGATMAGRAARALFTAALVALLAGTAPEAMAQVGGGGGGGGGAGGTYALKDGERNLKFAGVPIPGYSDVLGANLGLVAMAYYKMDRTDDELPPSATGVFGFYSANNSWMGGVFQKFHLDHDNWRITAAFGTGSVKYQFNPAAVNPGFPDMFLDYTTGTGFVFAQGSRRTYDHLYLGLAAVSWTAKVKLEPDLIETEDERYTGPGFVGEWDGRNHIMYPTGGFVANARFILYDDAFGSDNNFQNLSLSLSGYQSVADTTHVLAGRLLSDAAHGDVPFSGQTIVNGNRNLRGYSNGRHRADKLLMMEAEWRWNFWRRWGAVAFAGLAWSADELDEMSLGETLPASGLGLRFRLIETFKINARVDYAWGQNDQALYISVGEAY